MIRIFFIFVLILILGEKSFAYKVYSFDSNGNKVYTTVEREDYARFKNAPKRAFQRVPRTNWEITDEMRARKKLSSEYTNRR